MKRYSPSKARIEREWARHARSTTRQRSTGLGTPDNSDPWQKTAPGSVADLLRISDEIARLANGRE
jgi:hypothetical protein